MKRTFLRFIVGISVLGCSGFLMATEGEDYDVQKETSLRPSLLAPEEPQTRTFVFETEIMKMHVSHSVTLSQLPNYVSKLAPCLNLKPDDDYTSISYLFDYGIVKTDSSKDKNLLIRAMLKVARAADSQTTQELYDIWDDESTDIEQLFPAQEEENVGFEKLLDRRDG